MMAQSGQSEVFQWLTGISCGLNLSDLSSEFEGRGFLTKESLKYVDGTDLDTFFPSPQKLSYAKKKILLREIENISKNGSGIQVPTSTQFKPAASRCLINLPSTSQGPRGRGGFPEGLHQIPAINIPPHVQKKPDNISTSSPIGSLDKKEGNLSDDVQFLEARIASAKHEYTKLQKEADQYDELAPRQGRLCSTCHQPGHNKGKCKNKPCPGVSSCNHRSKHPETKSEMNELLELIKSLEKKAEKSRNNLQDLKAAREKAANSFFGIMRPRLKMQNAMKYAGTDRLILDRDLMILKKALNGKVPLDEHKDWRLPLIIEEFKRKNIGPFHMSI